MVAISEDDVEGCHASSYSEETIHIWISMQFTLSQGESILKWVVNN